ncbi:hypothetical protein OF117_07365 [Geodermatophilus sp. YIM 151500]|uniref:hypothetical protein n=1 Tax=Geodermatophilus sp. YIM 151500 TaxID=2984531 RepID=UPI0021E3857D|nr:hypothetical protein [Geodermatophilus sp. YIM 151500]MCV2489179.1 hypothetical protein [Geodermatophilus sp. YIM 151500]
MDEQLAGSDPAAKLSPRVTERLAAVDQRSPLEVVVEMQPVAVPDTGSRASRIEAVKAGFEEELRGVAERIAAVGGEVLETAWVNQTLRGTIPAAELVRVAEDDAVTAIDLPRPLEPDSGTPN